MKRILLTFSIMFFSVYAFTQIKVFASGNSTFGDTNINAAADIHIATNHNPTFRMGETGDLTDYFEIKDQGDGRLEFNKLGAAGKHVNIDYNPRPFSNAKNSNFRFFRYTDANNGNFTIFEGQNTTTINSIFASRDDSFFNAVHGDVAIGINNPLGSYKLHVEGTAYKTSGGDLWAVPSDKRLKKNIKRYEGGLDLITSLNPVEYEYNGKCGTKDGDYQIGVIAQDLRKVAPFMINEVTHQTIDINEWGEKSVVAEEDILTINASSLKWILVDAVKEQQELITDQEEEIAQLKNKMAFLEDQITRILNETNDKITLTDDESYHLGQNIPNPFSDFTSINYSIPHNAEKAVIEFFNVDGKVLKTYDIENAGDATLDINSVDLPTGVYSYRLIVDNRIIDTKQMVKMK